jgi:hypothetical protein
MSSTTDEIPAAVLAVLALPPLDELTDEQAGGRACAWCRDLLTIETAIPLGEHMAPVEGSTSISGMRCFPRACRTCVADRAHRGLLAHGSTCSLCRDEETAADCTVGRGLYRLVREHWHARRGRGTLRDHYEQFGGQG